MLRGLARVRAGVVAGTGVLPGAHAVAIQPRLISKRKVHPRQVLDCVGRDALPSVLLSLVLGSSWSISRSRSSCNQSTHCVAVVRVCVCACVCVCVAWHALAACGCMMLTSSFASHCARHRVLVARCGHIDKAISPPSSICTTDSHLVPCLPITCHTIYVPHRPADVNSEPAVCRCCKLCWRRHILHLFCQDQPCPRGKRHARVESIHVLPLDPLLLFVPTRVLGTLLALGSSRGAKCSLALRAAMA
jgi:hypothetical protein